jgi:hypothetical protein
VLSAEEQTKLTEACRVLPVSKNVLPKEDNYVLLAIAMVLDFQLNQPVVDKAVAYFKEHHRFDDHRRLRELVERFADTDEGNQALANTLWNNNLWTRAKYLRLLVNRFEERGINDLVSLSTWVANANFESDIHGQFKTENHSMGITMFQYFRLRLGHDTVKPDSKVLAFVDKVLQRKTKPLECVHGIEAAARTLSRSARELDAAIYKPASSPD